MNNQYNTEARQAMEDSISIAFEHSNPNLEPIHLLQAIIDSVAIASLITSEQKAQLRVRIADIIKTLPKQHPQTTPTPTNEFNVVLLHAQKIGKPSITVAVLVQALLKNNNIRKLMEEVVGGPINVQPKEMDTNEAMRFAVDMVQQAREGRFDPVIGRDEEIRLVIEILAKKTKSNPILVGMPGVGKTAIVNGLAQLIARDQAPGLRNHKIYNVDVGAMLAGSGVRGELEERLKSVIAEAEKNNEIILFIDEIHMLLSGSLGDSANMLKPGLASGAIKCIGATTYDEYRKYIEKDAAFARRFVTVHVREPSIEDTITMLRGIKERLESHHGAKITDSAVVFAAKAAKKYIPSRRLPDIAIDLVDTACASAMVALESEPAAVLSTKRKLWSAELEKTAIELDMKRGEDLELSRRLADVENKINNLKEELKPLEDAYQTDREKVNESKRLKRRIEDLRLKLANAERDRDHYTAVDIRNNVLPVIEEKLRSLEGEAVIGPGQVAEVVSRWTGIPVSRLTLREHERLKGMERRLNERVIGQVKAVEAVSQAILQGRVGLSGSGRPIAGFLFLGPTGVGKTELAKALSYELFDDDRSMVVLDMSDYGNEMAVTKMIGVSAGYVGYGEGGTLTEPVRNKPYNVVLLDEIDLAHPKVLALLYQLLDEGRLTDGKGNIVDFTNCVIIMTTNLGQEDMAEPKKVERKLVDRFGPALFNRVDRVIYFDSLTKEVLSGILENTIKNLNKELREKKIFVEMSEAVKKDILERTYSPVYGARPLKRYIQQNIVNALAQILLMKSDTENGIVVQCRMIEEGIMGEVIGEYVYVVNDVKV
ncbi:Chaperone protein ClpB1 [Astathelohania contejeani]|uniref:Chaperone protein ClpB1 n=1 Tax=Astathelohania contejeani TaxID=164912 RepID=A0ABQ7HXY1_9MICR|nr:Chaperone protein ClpB1 [Thelohania contejeani]